MEEGAAYQLPPPQVALANGCCVGARKGMHRDRVER